MKKLLAIAFAGIIALAQPSFSNNSIQNSTKHGLTVDQMDVSSDEVGKTMNALSYKPNEFISSTTVTVNQLSCMIDHATKTGSNLIRLSIVKGQSGNNYLIVNYYLPDSTKSFDTEYGYFPDRLGQAFDSTQPCCPRCSTSVATRLYIIK